MKKLIYGSLFLTLVGMVIVGCQKENLKPTTALTKTYNSVPQGANAYSPALVRIKKLCAIFEARVGNLPPTYRL